MTDWVAITSGEPAGIGPDIILQAAALNKLPRCVILGDLQVLRDRAELLKLPVELQEIHQIQDAEKRGSALPVLSIPVADPVIPGQLNPANSSSVIEMLTTASTLALTNKVSAIVTAPVHKGVINQAGIPFRGHTEFFAELSKTPKVVMLLAYGNFRVALATTHLPLAKVPEQITREHLDQTLSILIQGLQSQFQIPTPCILVCGLNPHAGEQGHLGREEIDVIAPVIKTWQSRGANVKGPYPADTVFLAEHIRQSDAILAMYHDQGLPTLKYAGFDSAVNITLGLPYRRTSVDHGTACELAGTGRASCNSLIAAVELAL